MILSLVGNVLVMIHLGGKGGAYVRGPNHSLGLLAAAWPALCLVNPVLSVCLSITATPRQGYTAYYTCDPRTLPSSSWVLSPLHFFFVLSITGDSFTFRVEVCITQADGGRPPHANCASDRMCS